MNDEMKRIIIAEAFGEKPTWDQASSFRTYASPNLDLTYYYLSIVQLCKSPIIEKRGRVGMFIGFRSGSNLNPMVSRSGEFDQVIGELYSEDSVSVLMSEPARKKPS